MQELQPISCFRHSCSYLHLTILLLVSSLGACRRAIRVLNSFSNIFQKMSTYQYGSIKNMLLQKQIFDARIIGKVMFQTFLLKLAFYHIVTGTLIRSIKEGNPCAKFFFEHFSESEYLSLKFHKNMFCQKMFEAISCFRHPSHISISPYCCW